MSATRTVFEDAVSQTIPSKYVQSISDLEKGAEFLKALGDFVVDFPSEVKAQAKEVSKGILDLLKKVKGTNKDTVSGISDLGIFLDSLFRKYMTSGVSTNEAATICQVAEIVLDKLNEQMTPGMGKAVNGHISKGKVWRKCEGCGFVIPAYPGRYPKFCPECGDTLGANMPPVKEENMGKVIVLEAVADLDQMIKNLEDGDTYSVSCKTMEGLIGRLPKGIISWKDPHNKGFCFIAKRERPPTGIRIDAVIPMDKKVEQVNESGVNITRKMFDWFKDHQDLTLSKTLIQFSQQFDISDMKAVNSLYTQYIANNMNWEQIEEASDKKCVKCGKPGFAVDKNVGVLCKECAKKADRFQRALASHGEDVPETDEQALDESSGVKVGQKFKYIGQDWVIEKVMGDKSYCVVTSIKTNRFTAYIENSEILNALKKEKNEQVFEDADEAAFDSVDEQGNGMTPGMQSAFDKIKYKSQCPVCGMLIPKYRGRYPKHCIECGYDLEQVLSSGNGVRGMMCPRCGGEGFGGGKCGRCGFSSLQAEECVPYDSAVVEVLNLLNGTPINEDNHDKVSEKLTESCKRFGVEFRGMEIAEALLTRNPNIPAIIENALIHKFGSADKTTLVANVKKYVLNLKDVAEEFSKLDDATLCAISPLLVEIDKLSESNLCKSLYTRLVELYPDFYAALNTMRARNLSLSQKDHEEISAFITEMYDRSLTPVDVCEQATPEYYEDVAKKVLSADILDNLRMEVVKRTDLHKNIRKLLPENLDFNKAVLAFSSCLSRVVKENDLRRVPSLNVFRSLTYEKMGNLFEGRKVGAVNFLKGVFLSAEDRK
jgi:hypothetical protein